VSPIQSKSVLSSVRPEYVPLESHLAEPIAWCPPPKSEEDTTLFVIVKSASNAPRILKLVDGKVITVSARKLPFVSAIAPKPKRLIDYVTVKSVLTTFAYAAATVVLAFVLAVSTNLMSARVVLTGSMSGTIEAGDVVVAAHWLEPKVNDIAIYQARDFEGVGRAEFVHRIIGGSPETAFVFKGDANPEKDVLPVPKKDIVGVVLFYIPSIGTLLNPKTLLAIFSIGIFIYFAAGYIRDELLERKYFRRKASN
jgi:signal peptidase I